MFICCSKFPSWLPNITVFVVFKFGDNLLPRSFCFSKTNKFIIVVISIKYNYVIWKEISFNNLDTVVQ